MTKQMTPLRRRMIVDMTIRNMSPSTQKGYAAAVANFSIFHGRSPDHKAHSQRLRGFSGAKDEVLLTATAQNSSVVPRTCHWSARSSLGAGARFASSKKDDDENSRPAPAVNWVLQRNLRESGRQPAGLGLSTTRPNTTSLLTRSAFPKFESYHAALSSL
jgi:hypothetical protein